MNILYQIKIDYKSPFTMDRYFFLVSKKLLKIKLNILDSVNLNSSGYILFSNSWLLTCNYVGYTDTNAGIGHRFDTMCNVRILVLINMVPIPETDTSCSAA